MDKVSQIQQESDVPDVQDLRVIKAEMMGKLKRVKAHPREILPKILRGQSRTTLRLSRSETIPKKARRERGKENILLLPHQLPVQH